MLLLLSYLCVISLNIFKFFSLVKRSIFLKEEEEEARRLDVMLGLVDKNRQILTLIVEWRVFSSHPGSATTKKNFESVQRFIALVLGN